MRRVLELHGNNVARINDRQGLLDDLLARALANFLLLDGQQGAAFEQEANCIRGDASAHQARRIGFGSAGAYTVRANGTDIGVGVDHDGAGTMPALFVPEKFAQ